MGAMISLHEGKGSRRRKPAERVCQLHLKVAACQPLIWRRLLVRESMWLSRLHDTIQVAFDWYDYQTHLFTFGDLRFGNPFKRDELVIEDDRDVTLADLGMATLGHFGYSYNFDDGWQVEIAVESVGPAKKRTYYSVSARPASARGLRRIAADPRPIATCWPASRNRRPNWGGNGWSGWAPATIRPAASWTRSTRRCASWERRSLQAPPGPSGS